MAVARAMEQPVPQEPQSERVFKGVSQEVPSALQSPQPAAHEVTRQEPVAHVSLA